MAFLIGDTAWGDGDHCRLSFRSSQRNVRFALQLVRDFLDRRDRRALQDTLEIVLAEALNNIEEHAFVGQEPGEIRLSVDVEADRVSIRITDDGRQMPGGQLPQGQMPELAGVPMQDLPEGGFGWALIHELTHELSYARQGEQNLLCFAIAA